MPTKAELEEENSRLRDEIDKLRGGQSSETTADLSEPVTDKPDPNSWPALLSRTLSWLGLQWSRGILAKLMIGVVALALIISTALF